MIFAGFFAVIVGVGMIAQWAMSYFSMQIPELKTEPIRIAFHIAAEMVTALVLLISGTGILLGWGFSQSMFLVGVGMLFYTAIVSPGYFAQKGNWKWLIMFSGIICVGIISIFLIL